MRSFVNDNVVFMDICVKAVLISDTLGPPFHHSVPLHPSFVQLDILLELTAGFVSSLLTLFDQ